MDEEIKDNLPIKSWAEEDRPREKLLLKGRQALSDAELLAILIRTGTRKETAVELAKRILNAANNNLNQLAKFSVEDLLEKLKGKGIGKTKAITIVAALELGRRRTEAPPGKNQFITFSKDVFEIFQSKFQDLPHEEFWILMLNRSNRIIKAEPISTGGVAGTIVDTKKIFKAAVQNLATGIILCHNHPSGNVKPSEEDIRLTRNLKEAGRIMEVSVHDHIIIGENNYFSFADEGMM